MKVPAMRFLCHSCTAGPMPGRVPWKQERLWWAVFQVGPWLLDGGCVQGCRVGSWPGEGARRGAEWGAGLRRGERGTEMGGG